MKTWLITNSGIVPDTHAARIEDFKFLAQWTGDEWTADTREAYARREVSEDVSDPEDIDDPTMLETPWTVSWDDRENGATGATEVARFATEAEAQTFADKENKRLLHEHITGDWHHLQLDLPDGWEPQIGRVEQGKYPQSRKVFCRLHGPAGIFVDRHARWDSNGVTNTWMRGDVVKHTFVDMIADLLTEAVTKATEEAETE